jgi:hypothetical protein
MNVKKVARSQDGVDLESSVRVELEIPSLWMDGLEQRSDLHLISLQPSDPVFWIEMLGKRARYFEMCKKSLSEETVMGVPAPSELG